MMGLRMGDKPQAIITKTPRTTQIIIDLIKDPRNIVTTGSTYENRANLSSGFFDYVIKKYEGTRMGRQELNAELLTDNPGALWKRDNIDQARVIQAPELDYIIVGVDPSASSNGDEAGRITAGRKGED